MSSDIIFELTHCEATLTQAVANNPQEEITKLARKLYADKLIAGSNAARRNIGTPKFHEDYTQEDLDRAAKCGQFPNRPSDLFLKASRTPATYKGLLFIGIIDVLRCLGYP
jgi:hypothetical protein